MNVKKHLLLLSVLKNISMLNIFMRMWYFFFQDFKNEVTFICIVLYSIQYISIQFSLMTVDAAKFINYETHLIQFKAALQKIIIIQLSLVQCWFNSV